MTLFVAPAGVLSSSVIAQRLENLLFPRTLRQWQQVRQPSQLRMVVRKCHTLNVTKINHVDNVVLVHWPTGANRASNIVLLRTGAQHGATGPTNGILVQGTITSSDLVGPLKGKHISDLVKDMLDGNVDLWITTTTNLMIAGKVTPAGAA